MLQATLLTNSSDLPQILELQQQNLLHNITDAERDSQGFVTMHHDLFTLQAMNNMAPAVIIKVDQRIVGYALTMLTQCRQLMPQLEPMFQLFETLHWNDRSLKEYSFYVMGQVCVSKDYRGQGLVKMLYDHHRETYQSKYDLIITEIATRNVRSMKAHEKIGFKTMHIHKDTLDEWAIVGWDWK